MNNAFLTSRRQAFSLVELAIVLVILGLLIGGILSGKSLIRAAELRSATNDYQRFYSAIHVFRDKYFSLPGDIPNAVKFWGAQAGSTADGVDNACAALTTAATGTLTCNGDGSGIISDDGPATTRDQFYEVSRAWQQLANAGLIEGNYSGVSTARTMLPYVTNVNTPGSRIGKSAMWLIRGYVQRYEDADWFKTEGNFFTLGINRSNSDNSSPALRPEEAWNIDTKIDDGKPGTGKVKPYKGDGTVNPGCTVDGTDTTSYMLTTTSIACALNMNF